MFGDTRSLCICIYIMEDYGRAKSSFAEVLSLYSRLFASGSMGRHRKCTAGRKGECESAKRHADSVEEGSVPLDAFL